MSDPKKRETYDRFGLKGLQEGADGFSGSSIFEEIFGQMGGPLGGFFPGGGARRKPRRGEDTVHHLKYVSVVSLLIDTFF